MTLLMRVFCYRFQLDYSAAYPDLAIQLSDYTSIYFRSLGKTAFLKECMEEFAAAEKAIGA